MDRPIGIKIYKYCETFMNERYIRDVHAFATPLIHSALSANCTQSFHTSLRLGCCVPSFFRTVSKVVQSLTRKHNFQGMNTSTDLGLTVYNYLMIHTCVFKKSKSFYCFLLRIASIEVSLTGNDTLDVHLLVLLSQINYWWNSIYVRYLAFQIFSFAWNYSANFLPNLSQASHCASQLSPENKV